MFRLVVVSCLLALAFGATIPKSRKALRNLKPNFPSGRIVGGEPTPIEDIPYQVALEKDGVQFCGGTIIGPRTILSSANCVYGFWGPEINIRTGSSKLLNGGTVIQVANLTYHPKYSIFSTDYDVSVLELEEDIDLSKPGSANITLATEEPTSGDLLVSGWGTFSSGGESPDTLYSVVVPVVDRAFCEEAFAPDIPFTARMICAGETGKDTCEKDEGGPAVAGSGDNKVLVGIASRGYQCSAVGYPSVYTNVANNEIIAFIKQHEGV